MSQALRRILVVEDERTIAESIAVRLRAEGFAVELAYDGPTAVAKARSAQPDLVVLDVMLPGFDGLEVCRRIQAERAVSVLMLTARGDETDLLVGLAVGADDYLTKPFSMRELAARVHALLRRVDRTAARVDDPDGRTEPPIVVGDLEINRAERRVRRAGVEAHLTPTEFDLLVHLARRPRAVLPRERLLADVWGWADATGTRTVDSHVKALRRKLGADLIRTVHGVGYALDGPAATSATAASEAGAGVPAPDASLGRRS
jgi:DNA-binding response OmpR family regulator